MPDFASFITLDAPDSSPWIRLPPEPYSHFVGATTAWMTGDLTCADTHLPTPPSADVTPPYRPEISDRPRPYSHEPADENPDSIGASTCLYSQPPTLTRPFRMPFFRPETRFPPMPSKTVDGE